MTPIFLNGFKIENTKQLDDRLNIEGWACHFNRANLNNEVVDKDSFNKFFSMYEEKKIVPVLNWNHDPNQIIGGIDSIIAFDEGLYMEAHINKGVKICDDMIIPNVLNETLNSFSTEGYILNGWNGIQELEDNKYYVKDFVLTATAIVATPADWDAKFTLKNFIEENRPKPQSKWYLIR